MIFVKLIPLLLTIILALEQYGYYGKSSAQFFNLTDIGSPILPQKEENKLQFAAIEEERSQDYLNIPI